MFTLTQHRQDIIILAKKIFYKEFFCFFILELSVFGAAWVMENVNESLCFFALRSNLQAYYKRSKLYRQVLIVSNKAPFVDVLSCHVLSDVYYFRRLSNYNQISLGIIIHNIIYITKGKPKLFLDTFIKNYV